MEAPRIMTSAELLPAVRDLYSRLPETRCLLAWELGIILWSLNYTDDLEDEARVEAARDVALLDLDPDRRAA
jgi:hypothetical protein